MTTLPRMQASSSDWSGVTGSRSSRSLGSTSRTSATPARPATMSLMSGTVRTCTGYGSSDFRISCR
jgi:hypothetical protein